MFTPETVKDPSKMKMALTWKAPLGSFKEYANLKVISSMGAGVDHLFDDPSLPQHVMLTRMTDEKLSGDMQEFVLALCLNVIKNLNSYSRLQGNTQWTPMKHRHIADVSVGILGFGTLGQAVGKKLVEVGFPVSGWSKSAKEISGIKSFTKGQLDAFLRNCNILVCLLPLTSDTHEILNDKLFQIFLRVPTSSMSPAVVI